MYWWLNCTICVGVIASGLLLSDTDNAVKREIRWITEALLPLSGTSFSTPCSMSSCRVRLVDIFLSSSAVNKQDLRYTLSFLVVDLHKEEILQCSRSLQRMTSWSGIQRLPFRAPQSTGYFDSSLLSYYRCAENMKTFRQEHMHWGILMKADFYWYDQRRKREVHSRCEHNDFTSQTFWSFLELLAAFLLPPLPWLEDLAKGWELALTLWGAVPCAAPLSHHCAVVLLSFIIYNKSSNKI